MDSDRSSGELEDGEIRDDDYEDISDCSLSDILQEVSSDNEVDSLRQEALKSLQPEDETNEEEQYRLEALKSLLQNTDFLDENEESLPEIDDLTEEEKYRLEAIKSLLRNTDFLSNFESTTSNSKKRKRKKRMKNSTPKRSKQVRLEKKESSSKEYLKETTSLLSELSEDVKNINKTFEIQKTDDSANINKENDTQDDKICVIESVTSLRSWYPKTEFTLLDISSVQNIDLTCFPSDSNHKVINEREHVVRKKVKKSPKKRTCDKNLTKLKKLPEVNLTVDSVTDQVQNLTKQIPEAVPTPMEIVPLPEKSPISNESGKLSGQILSTDESVIKILPKVSIPPKLHTPERKPIECMSTKASVPCNFRKFRTVLPPPNKIFSFTRRKERYKINHIRNNSKYVLRKTNLKIDKSKLKLNKIPNTRYSINHTNKYPQVNPKEFIIPLDEDDSSKEEDYKEPHLNMPESHDEISSSNNAARLDLVKEEPLEVKEESHDDLSLLELPSTTTIETSTTTIKEESFIGVIDTEPSLHESDTVEDVQSEEISSAKCETSDITPPPSLPEPENIAVQPQAKNETDLLYEAEANLIEIRSKLLSSLDELNVSMKQNVQEKEKLFDLMKKLNLLKATIKKFEDKINSQKMKLAMSNSFMRSHFEGVILRSKTCSRMKDLCSLAGQKIIGPEYRPPEEFEAQVKEKQRTVDFSKYVRNSTGKK